MTVNANTLKKGTISGEGIKSIAHKVDPANFPFKQGDLVFQNAGLAKPVTADADVAKLLGVALSPTAPSSNIDNGSSAAELGSTIGWDGLFMLNTTASETYVSGTDVYLGADAQTITTVVGTNKVGTVLLPPNIASVTGAAGVKVPVVIKSKIY